MFAFARSKPPPVVLGTMVLLFGIFVVSALAKSTSFYTLMSSNLAFTSGGVLGELKLWTLITHVAWPSVVWFNVVINCLMLYMFASELENWWGSSRTLVFFVLTSLGAGLACLAVGFFTPTATFEARPLVVACIAAWALIFRDRQSSLFGIVQLKGIHYLWLSLGIIILDALSFGLMSIVPRVGAVLVAVGLSMGLWRKNFVKVTWGDFLAKVGLRKKPKLTIVPPIKKPGKYDIN